MAYPAGFSSDEDEFDGFLSVSSFLLFMCSNSPIIILLVKDDSDDLVDQGDAIQLEAEGAQQRQNVNAPPQLTMEQKLNNLFYAIMNGNVEQVLSSLEDGNWLLFCYEQIILFFIFYQIFIAGLNANVVVRDDWSAILLAASIGDPEVVRELINKGADVNSDRGITNIVGN